MADRAKPIAPAPIVVKPRLAEQGLVKPGVRTGRGFSIGELEQVGLTVAQARRLGLRVDPRRRSIRRENVETLRKFLAELSGE